MENEQIRVLLVDDDQGDFEMFRVMLAKAEQEDYKVDWVSSFEEAIDAFDAAEHDVYFLDYFLEDRTGLDLLKEARTRGVTAPVIMLTGRGSRTIDMEAMELGASDYLVKGLIDPDALERAIRHAMERKEGARAVKERDERRDRIVGNASAGTPNEEFSGNVARFRAVFESTRSGIALVDLNGVLLEVNPAFAAMFSLTTQDMGGLSYLDQLDESDKEAVSKEIELLSRGERARFEAARRFLIQEARKVWAHTTMALIRDEEGEPDHLVVVMDKVAEGG